MKKFLTLQVTIATVYPVKNTPNFRFKSIYLKNMLGIPIFDDGIMISILRYNFDPDKLTQPR